MGFTFQPSRPDEPGATHVFDEPIQIKENNSQILQDNCLRCHGDFVHDVVRGSTWADNAIRCVHCHRGVGHGATRGRPRRPWRTEPQARARRLRRSSRSCVAVATAGVAALLVNIFERKQEAKNPFLKLVEVTEDDVDPAKWGINWPREYDGYQRTAEPTSTKYGGGPVGPEGTLPPAEGRRATPG